MTKRKARGEETRREGAEQVRARDVYRLMNKVDSRQAATKGSVVS